VRGGTAATKHHNCVMNVRHCRRVCEFLGSRKGVVRCRWKGGAGVCFVLWCHRNTPSTPDVFVGAEH
jgi:hypothetical protein